MYHAKDRTIDAPIAETSGLRGGIHNSLTRIRPSLELRHRRLRAGLGAGIQRDLGPTGNQRDEITTIPPPSQEVQYS